MRWFALSGEPSHPCYGYQGPENRKYSAEKHDFFLPLPPKTTYIGKILPKYSVFTNFHAIMA